jgi:hypothetical protein
MNKLASRLVVASFALGAGAAPAAAQLANTLPAAMGMADNYTAVARGYAAVAWNPAALGMLGGPRASASIGGLRVAGGMGPVTLRDLSTWQDRTVPLDVRERWLADIRREGAQSGGAGFDIVVATFQAGRFAAQVSTSGRSLTDITPGVAEIILVGNADDDGNLSELDLGGSLVDANVYSTGAISYGMPVLHLANAARLSVGMTVKYTIGHVLGVSQQSVGGATAEPARTAFSFPFAYTPVVHSGNRYYIRSGSGFGVDLAAGYEMGPLSVAAVVQNAFNSFEWDHSRLRYRPLDLIFEDGEVETSVDWQPMSEAPAELRARVADATFDPSVSIGAAYQLLPQLLLSADARAGSTGGMMTRPPNHIGAGAAYSPVRWLPLHAGASWVSLGNGHSGIQLAGGLGFQLGSFLVSGSAMRRHVGLGAENMFMVNLLSHTF